MPLHKASRKGNYNMAVDLSMRIYNSEIREVAHYKENIIINQSHWYPESKYTEEQAKEHFLREHSLTKQ